MANSWWFGNPPPAWPLQPWLALRIVLAGLIPLAVVAALVWGVLLPQLRADLEIRYQTLAHALAGQIETHLLGAGRQLRAITEDLRNHPHDLPASYWFGPLDAHAGTSGVFAAIYITDSDDSVYSVGLPQSERGQRGDLLKLDLSKWATLREVREHNKEVWSETFLSAVTSRLAVTLAIPVADQVLVGEIAIDRLSAFLDRSPAEAGMVTMILDRQGQIIAHSQAALSGQQLSLGHLPIVGDALQGQFATRSFEWDGETFVGATVSVPQLSWIVLVAQPRSEAFRPFLSTLWVLAAGALVALLLAILVAWVLSRGFARRIGRYAEQTHAIAEGNYDQPWPISHIREFDRLADDLDRMSLAIRQRERDLATSEARFRSVISNAPVVLFQFDEQGIVTFSEGKGLAGIGLAPGKAVGQSLFELYRDSPEVCEYARRALGGEAFQCISKTGDIFFDVSYSSVRDPNGHIQVTGVAMDITERQRAVEALQQANLVVENSPVMLFRWKAEDGWPVAFVSHNVKQLGYSPEELLDGSFRFASLVYPEDVERVGHEVQSYVERGVDQFQQEYRIVAKDGTVRWVDDRTVVERNAEGRITHYQGIVIDITERKRDHEALRRSETDLQLALEVARLGHWKWDIRSGEIVWSERCKALYGLSPDTEVTYELFLSRIHPDDRARTDALLRGALEQRGGYELEKRIVWPDGSVRWTSSVGRVVCDADNQPVLMAGATLDITERKRAEEALRRGNRQLRMLSDCNQALIRITDEIELLTTICAIVVQVGDYRMAWVGYAEQDASKTIRPMAHAGFEEGYLDHLNTTWADTERGRGANGTAIRTGRPCLIQNIACDPQFAPWRAEAAERGYAALCALPLKIGDQTLGALSIYSSVADAFDAEELNLLSELASDLAFGVAVLRAQAERKRAEQKLLESERKYRELVENANSIILRWNPEGEITFVNEFGLKFFGYSEEALIGRHVVGTIVPPDETTGRDLRPLMEDICLHPERFERNVNENMRRDGERVWVAWTNKAVLDDRGHVVEVFSVGSDITDRKRAEAELQRYRERLEELVAERTAELRQAMTQLVQAEKLAALGHLVAGVAHELNTPLGNARVVASALSQEVSAFAAAVESGALRRSQVDQFLNRGREAADLLERNTARAADLIENFKQVAVDQTSVRRRRFPLRQTIEELLTTLHPQMKHTAHRLELDIPPNLELDSYPGPLEQVIANLVSNSLVHGFAGIAAGAIRIHAAPLGPDRVQIDYADDGVGIPETILSRIFEPFFTTRLGQGGSGLGLYIVYNLITSVLGGAIQAHSQPGYGATFTFMLPRIAPDRSALESPAQSTA